MQSKSCSLLYGEKFIAIRNCGILLQKELKIDFISFLNSHSKNQLLIIYWEGEIENDKLYFLSKVDGAEIDISGLSYQII